MSTALTGMVFNARRGRLKRTGQISAYMRGDDGATRRGLLEQFDIETLGQYSLTSDIEVAHLADSTLSFTAPNVIASAGNLLVGWAVNDRMVIKGSANNDGEVLVTGVGGAPANLTISAAVNELAGAVISLYKVVAHSNECVRDLRTGLMWSRYTSNGEKVGVLSNGTLNWYDVATLFPLHGAAADLQMVVPGNILRIVGGAAEITRYHEGDLLKPGGFTDPNNNLPGLYVMSATVVGADLDILVDPMGLPALTAEAAGGARSIGFVTRSVFNYAAGARLIGLANYTDWRNPNDGELVGIRDMEAPNAEPDAIAFPGWVGLGSTWDSTTVPNAVATAMVLAWTSGINAGVAKTAARIAALVRG